jgi:hypothetical protein
MARDLRRGAIGLGLVVTALVALPGCGPSSDHNTSSKPAAMPSAHAGGGQRLGPEAVVNRIALISGNWTNSTVTRHYQSAIGLSIGAARTQLSRQAVELEAGLSQTHTQVRSRLAVEVVKLRGRGDTRRGLVVVREGIAGAHAGIEGARYRVVLVELRRTRGSSGWLVSQWSPQS